MDLELAKDMTYSLMKSASEKEPEKNDFIFSIQYGGETYNAIWMKDINVDHAEWHITIEKHID
ncbi:MAG: hypothetical protein EOO90_03535 [Pedobacter sp.]|nr:MAG: hypothetical protein EOO90_03535 [Pedobacter sp.]